ncbi:MAG: hypothetical protein JWR51_3339 [Devosia sp.]|uniref:hypothetical protein n=1 Tax=Devosia sp. TaxID=1871048 RepID=UPI0026053C4C|nr:hypothetical protein [Devosia sp.]MDB5530236.1 hypothetical protein [Devosia sp.]
MSNYDIASIGSITSAVGNWYRVKGTPDAPELDRVVLWAVAKVKWLNPETRQYEPADNEIVVGLLATDIGVLGTDYDEWVVGVAGYVELSDDQHSEIMTDPSKLEQFNLLWEE